MKNDTAQKAKKKVAKSLPRRILNILSNILLTLIILAVIAVSVAAIQSRASGTTPSIGGFQLLKVVSGSMEPVIHTGSVIVIKETINPAQLKVGDIVTFRSAEYDSQLVTHRIARIENTAEGLIFTTRGDANDADDLSPLPSSRIVGTTVLTIPLLGYAMNFIQSREGLVLMIIVPGMLLSVYEIKNIRKIVRGMKKARAERVLGIPEE